MSQVLIGIQAGESIQCDSDDIVTLNIRQLQPRRVVLMIPKSAMDQICSPVKSDVLSGLRQIRDEVDVAIERESQRP